MIKDILYNSDILEGLFEPSDFEFLKDSNNKQEKIEFKIKMVRLKREKIIECINKINIEGNELEKIDTSKLKKYVDSAEDAFEGTNKIVANLTELSNYFNEIEKNIIELIVKKESNTNENLLARVEKINQKIAIYKAEEKRIEAENEKNELKIEKFFRDNKLDTGLKENGKSIIEKKEISKNITNVQDNLELIVSERQKRVYLPYTKAEIEDFLYNYPDEYETARDVIEQEFIADISIYNKHPVLARFREAYSLCRNKEMKSPIDSLKFAMNIMFRTDLNPTIIAAVKSQKQLEDYIECLEKNKLDEFKYFTITFEVNPI